MFTKHLALRIRFVCWAGAAVAVVAATAGPALAQDNPPAVAVAPDTASKESFASELEIFFRAFETRDYQLLKPLLDDQVKIGSLPQGMNDRIVPQLVNQLLEPASYSVTSVVPEGNATRVTLLLSYANGKTSTQSVVFNADHKITALDLPTNVKKVQAVKVGGGTHVTPDKLEVPFELRNNMMIVSAELNGKKGSFILDSGATTLMLNADRLAPDQLQGSGIADGVGGVVVTRVSHIDTFNWNGLKISDFDAVAQPLGNIDKSAHITSDAGKSFFGLIGHDVFKDYQVTFDYARKMVTLVRTDKLGNPVVATPAPSGTVAVVPFEMHLHIPVFPMKVGARSYQMGLDCGASANLFYAKYLSDVGPHLSGISSQPLVGIGKEQLLVKTANLSHVSVGNAQYKEMLFAFEDGNLNQLNNGYQLGVDGLLGYEFLRQHVTSINYKKGELRIYDGVPKM